MKPLTRKILAGLLYTIPIVFFIVCYFVIVTSGEDIWQGAHSTVDIWGDAAAAFNHSVRLADMFAWSVINIFDYTFQFGPDIIIRVIDVLAAGSIMYMATYIALQRRPSLRLKDASVFMAIFLGIFLTSNGLTLYAGFSKIHNYLFITFFSLLFGIMYLRDLWGRKTPEKWWFAGFMLALGFVFGFSSNVTAIVFLLTLAIYSIYQLIIAYRGKNTSSKTKREFQQSIKRFFVSWRFAGVVGIFIALYVMYFIGNGLGDYDSSPVYRATLDYLPFAEIWHDIPGSVARIIHHNIYNFGRFLLPFAAMSLPVALYLFVKRKTEKFGKIIKDKTDQNYLVAAGIFIFMHVFAMSQIKYPTRLVLPAYIFALAVFVWVLMRKFNLKRLSQAAVKTTIIILLGLGTALLALRTIFAVNYVAKVSPILERIRDSEEQVVCIDWAEIKSPSIPYLHMEQEEFLVDWAMPQTIYGKTVSDCGTRP